MRNKSNIKLFYMQNKIEEIKKEEYAVAVFRWHTPLKNHI